MNRFLRAKHWQLFTLVFGLPMLFSMFSTFYTITAVTSGRPFDGFNELAFFPFIMILGIGGIFGWIWAIGVGLQDKIPAITRMKVKKFKIFFFIPVIYMLLILLFLFFGINFGSQNGGLLGGNDSSAFLWVLLIIPAHLFSMFCIFYCLYFVAKTIRTIELQRETTFSDFAGEFFLVWFYPIGIWILQPRINKLTQGPPIGTPEESNSAE